MTSPEQRQLAAELAREWSSRLRAAVEMMAQQPLSVAPSAAPEEAAAQAAELPSLAWSFSHAADAPFRVCTPRETSEGVAKVVLTASGIEEFDEALLQETWQEILSQAASGLAQHLGMRMGATVSCSSAPATSGELAEGVVSSAVLSIAETAFEPLFISFPLSFLDAVATEAEGDEAESDVDEAIAPGGKKLRTALPATMDMLLDVELPVSVSFGRTYLPVREVLKLATGSIIELDRPVNQYVEVVVNNCVIARGEVVVIEGNYGVRIHEIISRGDRMALPHMTNTTPYQQTRISA